MRWLSGCDPNPISNLNHSTQLLFYLQMPKSKNSRPKPKGYKCQDCSSTFSLFKDYKYHILQHQNGCNVKYPGYDKKIWISKNEDGHYNCASTSCLYKTSCPRQMSNHAQSHKQGTRKGQLLLNPSEDLELYSELDMSLSHIPTSPSVLTSPPASSPPASSPYNVEDMEISDPQPNYLDRIKFKLYPQLGLVFCLDCKYAVLPKHINNHGRNSGHINCSLTLEEQQDLIERGVHEEMIIPQGPIQPIPYLPQSKAFKCKKEECLDIFLTEATYKRHHQSIHTEGIIPCFAQQLYYQHFIDIITDIHSDNIVNELETFINTMQTTNEINIMNTLLTNSTDLRNTPQWIKTLGWAEKLENKSSQFLASLVDLPSKDDPLTGVLNEALVYYQNMANKISSTEPVIRKWLVAESKYEFRINIKTILTLFF